MLEGLHWRNSLVGVQRQTSLKEINEVVEITKANLTQLGGSSHKPGAKVACRLNNRQGFYRCLVERISYSRLMKGAVSFRARTFPRTLSCSTLMKLPISSKCNGASSPRL